MRPFFSVPNLLALAFLLALNGPAGAVVLSAQDPEARLRAAERILARRTRELLAAASQDLTARAARLGYDPERIFGFVRRETRFEPYSGFQRGPAGVLASGGGNAADRSLLLHELLKRSGFESRLVAGRLPSKRAEELLSTARPGSLTRFGTPFGAGRLDATRLKETCEEAGLNAAEWRRYFARGDLVRRTAWDEVLALVGRETAFLEARIAEKNLPGKEIDLRPEWLRAVRSHYWVQWRQRGEARWRDLDPSFGALPEEIRAGEVVNDPRPLADHVVIRLALERKAGEKRETVTLLRYEGPLYEQLTRPLRLQIQPTEDWPSAAKAETSRKFYERLRSYRRFQALLQVGGETYASKVFDYDGVVSRYTAQGAVAAIGRWGESTAKELGGARGLLHGGGQGAEKATLASLWVDLAVTRDGKRLWTRRRVILEEEKRESWSPILEWDFFFQNHLFTPEFIRSVRLAHRVKNDARVRSALQWIRSGKKRDPREVLDTPGFDYPLELLEFCLARQGYLARNAARVPYFDRPNLFLSARRVRLHPEKESVCLCKAIDIVENGALVLYGSKVDRKATTALGAFDTVLEEALVRRAEPAKRVTGTIRYFERARIASREIALVSAASSDALEGVGLAPEDVRAIRLHSRKGDLALVAPPEEGQPACWWEYDPDTGRAVGRISGGRGGSEVHLQASAEYLFAARIGLAVGCALWLYRAVATRNELLVAGAVLFCVASLGVSWLGGLPGASVATPWEGQGEVLLMMFMLVAVELGAVALVW